MVCKGCYTNLPPGALVCEVCGKEPPTIPCPHCKEPVMEGRRFCSHCRTPLNKETRPKAPEPKQIQCPNCENLLAPHRRFCNQCGSRQHGTPLGKPTVDKIPPSPDAKVSLAPKTTANEIPTQPRPKVERNREKIDRSARQNQDVSPRQQVTRKPSLQRESLEKTAEHPPKSASEPKISQVSLCPHCQHSTEVGRRFCPACHKRMVPLELKGETPLEIPEKKPVSPKVPPKVNIQTEAKKHTPPLTRKDEVKITPIPLREYREPPKKRPPLRFCPDCFGQMEGEICDFCLDHPPLPPIPSLPVRKPLQPQKIALVSASVAGVALCMGLGQMILVDEELPLHNSNQVDVNLNYPSNENQPSRPTESGEILPEAPPETPSIADGTEIPSINSAESSVNNQIPVEPTTVPEETAPPIESNPVPQEPQVEEESHSNSQIHLGQASGTCHDSEMAQIYRPVLHSYGYGLEFSWDDEDFSQANLNPKMAEESFASASYTFWDIDGNGTPELIVGTPETGGLIMELYTISNGQLTLLLRGNDRERYVLCSDGLIAHDDDNGTTLTLELRGNYLTIVEDQRKKDPYNLSDQAQIPFTPIAEYYFA